MKKFCLAVLFVMICSASWAATVQLKNGSTVSGSIVERTADSVKLNVSGVTLTYYSDEVASIDDGAAPSESAAVSSAPEAASAAEISAPVSAADVASSKKELILQFIDVFGTRDTMQTNFEQMAESMPAAQAEAFKKAFKVDEIIERLVPLYDKYFSEDELKDYINFYSTPLGQKLVTTLPKIMQESVNVSMKYFEEHMSELPQAPVQDNGAAAGADQ